MSNSLKAQLCFNSKSITVKIIHSTTNGNHTEIIHYLKFVSFYFNWKFNVDSNILEIHLFCICWTFANYCNCVCVCYCISFYFCSSKPSFYLPWRSSILPASRFQRYRRITRSQWNIADVLSLLLFCKRSNHI